MISLIFHLHIICSATASFFNKMIWPDRVEQMPSNNGVATTGQMTPNNSEEMEEIFICGDGWLAVFDLITPRQLGLEIALLSHRFDYFVDEHFKTRKWTLGMFCIIYKEGFFYGTHGMQIIVNLDGKWEEKWLPIPHKPVPNKFVRFKCIIISYFNQNFINSFHHFRPLFSYAETLFIYANKSKSEERTLLPSNVNKRMYHRQFAIDLFLNNVNCPLLRFIYTRAFVLFPEFPIDDSATATIGQVLAKWLFTPRPDGVPKMLRLKYQKSESDQWPSKIDALKKAFVSASSGASFIISIRFPSGIVDNAVVMPFDLFNYATGERMTLTMELRKRKLLLVRCPNIRDEQKWAKWEKEIIDRQQREEWNLIWIEL